MDKITKIQDDLAEMEVFKPVNSYTGKKLAEFNTPSENGVKSAIMSMDKKILNTMPYQQHSRKPCHT